MAESAVLDLRGHRTWEPGRLTAEAFRWPGNAPIVALGDIVLRLVPKSFADAGSPVVTPASVDPIVGGVRRRNRRYQGAAYQVGSELRNGDVLVPRTPRGIALLVSDHLAAAIVSSSFVALRPADASTGIWVWGLLNSNPGLELRQSLARGSATMALAIKDLMELPLPQLGVVEQHRLADSLRELESETHIAEEEAVETWWRVADLRGAEWRLMLATPHPELLNEGVPLFNLCAEIVRGRPLLDVVVEAEEEGSLPVTDISVLRGGKPRRWVPADVQRLTPVNVGDLCVAAVGERSHASVAHADAVADPNVFVLRLLNPEFGPALDRYLNGQEGFALRRMIVTGSVIPSLRLGDLERLPVSEDALQVDEVDDRPMVPLADRLERLLWSR